MSIVEIQNGSLADPEVVNDNFKYLDDKIKDTENKIYTNNSGLESKISTLSNNINGMIFDALESLYPIGSIYLSTTSTCPLATLFGEWTKIGSEIVTSVSSQVIVYGNGSPLPVNNNGSATAGTLYCYRSSYNEAIIANGGNYGNLYVASGGSSGLRGYNSVKKQNINIFKRTK